MADAAELTRHDDALVAGGTQGSLRTLDPRLPLLRNDTWLAMTGLVGALLALPLAQSSWHGPEVAAVLAVSATAMFAGQRWAIALVVIAELFLLPTVWPRAFFGSDPSAQLIAVATLAAIVPGVLAMRRAAVVLVMMSGQRRTQQLCRRVHAGLILIIVVGVIFPLI
jgi:hypothetical protein